jgi:hypothetical protein
VVREVALSARRLRRGTIHREPPSVRRFGDCPGGAGRKMAAALAAPRARRRPGTS